MWEVNNKDIDLRTHVNNKDTITTSNVPFDPPENIKMEY